jgi:hypothetical protein
LFNETKKTGDSFQLNFWAHREMATEELETIIACFNMIAKSLL